MHTIVLATEGSPTAAEAALVVRGVVDDPERQTAGAGRAELSAPPD